MVTPTKKSPAPCDPVSPLWLRDQLLQSIASLSSWRSRMAEEESRHLSIQSDSKVGYDDEDDDDVAFCSNIRLEDGRVDLRETALPTVVTPLPIRLRRNTDNNSPTEGQETSSDTDLISSSSSKKTTDSSKSTKRQGGASCSTRLLALFRFRNLCILMIACPILFRCQQAVHRNRKRYLALQTLDKFDASRQRTPGWIAPAKNPTSWAVFYNVYVSPDYELSELGRRLVREQLGQVASSYAASAGDLKVYTTTIGEQQKPHWLQDVCASVSSDTVGDVSNFKLTCTQEEHHESAQEDVTLTKVHKYCQDNPDKSVIYLHNKGSFHLHSWGQHRWRRTMTAAATSQLCLEPSATSAEFDQCNMCGMLFQPLPGNHFPGNMWAAKCSYVRQLLSPADYIERFGVVEEWIHSQVRLGVLSYESGSFSMMDAYTGKGALHRSIG